MRNSELDQLNRCSSVAIELVNGNNGEIIVVESKYAESLGRELNLG